MFVAAVHLIYLLISVVLTIWVARALSTHGRTFLVVHLAGDEPLADSLNRLLVIGFYLVNLGYASLALSWGKPPQDLPGAIEHLSHKVGLVLLVLGAMHLFNMRLISRWGRHAGRWVPAGDPAAPEVGGAP